MAKISYVEPKSNYRLLVELDTGMVIYINMTDKIETCRFLDLKEEEIFRDVSTDGSAVYWKRGLASMTLHEIYQLNAVDKPEDYGQRRAI